MSSKYNLTLIKSRRCYTPDEIARLFNINRKSCSRWLQAGLVPILPNTKPLLIRGSELRRFLVSETQKRKQPLRHPDEFYCLTCRMRIMAKEGSLDTVETGKRIGKENRKQLQKIGICPHCKRKVCKYL